MNINEVLIKIGNDILAKTKNYAAPKSHTHTKSQVGLGNVDNTADINKNVNNSVSVGDANMKIYPQIDSEINFGGENNQSTIYFGYRAKDKKPIPSTFIFGGSGGSSKIKAGSFVVGDKSAILEGDSRLTNSRPASDVYGWAKASSKPSYTKSEVGLGNVENKSSATIRGELTKANVYNPLTWTEAEAKAITDLIK